MSIKFRRFSGEFPAFCWLSLLIITLQPSRSFSQLAVGRSKFVGNVIHNAYSIRSDFSTFWNQVTPENDGKWGSVESSPGTYNWGALDNDYYYAIENGFPFKEHNLIWGSQQPSFMTSGSLDSAQEYQEIVNWIDTCGHRYPQAAFCDVVNEPIHTPPSYENALGGSGKTGWDWVINAFKLARKYWSPNTKLLINEYSVINSSSSNTQYLQIINLLKDSLLIDGIGVQAHSFEVATGGASVSTLKANLDKLAATGLPIYISEFAINDTNDTHQLYDYQRIFPMLYEDPGVKGITLWGYTYGETWELYAYLDSLGLERPALQWLSTFLVRYLFQPAVISPADTTIGIRNPVLVWHPSIAASSYRLQVAADYIFSTVVVDSTVADTMLLLPALNAGTKYYWHVAAMNASDTGNYSATVSFTTGDTVATAVEELGGMPKSFSLSQNYPNPFNPTTEIDYSVPHNAYMTLKVYNILGQEVATLFSGMRQAGNYTATFDGGAFASGIYFYRLSASGESVTRKLVLMK
jgi:GH35 family endo-1,4-beta-xylanase